jgi:hypothetical protein
VILFNKNVGEQKDCTTDVVNPQDSQKQGNCGSTKYFCLISGKKSFRETKNNNKNLKN